MKATRVCSVQECDADARTRGWCEKHYTKFKRYGDPLWTAPSRKPNLLGQRFGLLTVVADAGDSRSWHCACDCGGMTVARTWNLRNGVHASCGAGAHRHSELVGYVSAHKRVRAARGLARNHSCVDCGRPARHWSYDNTDPDALYESGRGHYSLDPSRYEPRCPSCHKHFDLAARHAATR
jgi:hypothetical protein